MEPIITSRSSRRKQREKLYKLRGIGIMLLFGIAAFIIFLTLFSYIDRTEEAMKVLGQNFGIFVLTVGVSYPAFLGALLPIRLSNCNADERKKLLEEVFQFVATFLAFICAIAFALIAVQTNLSIKLEIVSSMIGCLIGLSFVFISLVNKLLK
ncbi:hypothetical protein ACAF76_008355 [Brevibacillus sp. TJ4]|uniref:hypothetical protein n=1 Tax=Brevibacillus sp. TJ4 TaxID=3234853 RepID=UPI0037D86DA7